ncbi:MAG: hypothetical protein LBG71_00030, partial [Clostridiales Family XIII bacterium]|jgi:hypothetical protein|nr:hypothetical protein [Clostridiales Family XIII bacterium]
MENYGVADRDSIKAEVYYESRVKEGLYVPCYKVYVEQPPSPDGGGGTEYEILRVPIFNPDEAEG